MLNYIGMMPNPHEAEFNDDFIVKRDDVSIEELVVMMMKEFEVVENIEILSYEIIKDQDEVDYNYHMINLNYKKKNFDEIEIPKYKYISDNRYGEIVFKIKIETNKNKKIITKRIMIPMEDEDGFFIINSKRWKALWQLVDASTYSQRGKITLKSRMPIIVYHNKHKMIKDIHDETYYFPTFSYALNTKAKRRGSKLKTKFINPLMIYSAKIGLFNTIEYFGMKDIIYLTQEVEDDEDKYYYFPLNEIFIKVEKDICDKFNMVKSVVCMLYNLGSGEFPVEWLSLTDKQYWICRIGYIGSAKNKNILSFRDKGITTLYMIERLLDNITIMNLRLPEYYKQDIYSLLYWMITNFDELKARNNIDILNKRIRKNEYIVLSSLGKKISENINKLIEKKSKSKMNTMDSLLEMFNFGSDIIVSGMRNIGDLVKSDELVNDMTFLQDISYSSKGPNSLGENSSKMISAKYRYIHPSHLGIVDLNTTSNSDAGLSGSFVPFVEIYDKYYFTPDAEPCNGRYEFAKQLTDYCKERKIQLPATLPKKVKTFDDFIKYSDETNEFKDGLKYEEIRIVEKEDDPVDESTLYEYDSLDNNEED